MNWYECPKCGREMTEEQAYYCSFGDWCGNGRNQC